MLDKKTIEMLWAEFDVPTNDQEEILESFCGWPVFADREGIWRWFDEQYAKWGGVHALMFPSEHKPKSKYGTVKAEMNYQVWHRDYAFTFEEEEFDCAPALDELRIELVEAIADGTIDADDVYYEARDLGILRDHNGPFYVVVGDCDEYIEARRKDEACTRTTTRG